MAIVVDTSALAAVVFGEPDAQIIAAALAAHAGDISISAATLIEAHIVVESRQGGAAVHDLQRLLDSTGTSVVSVDTSHAQLAIAAWRRFGRGRHPAALNFGDCFSYSLSKMLGAPLLYKGDDFTQTDVASAL